MPAPPAPAAALPLPPIPPQLGAANTPLGAIPAPLGVVNQAAQGLDPTALLQGMTNAIPTAPTPPLPGQPGQPPDPTALSSPDQPTTPPFLAALQAGFPLALRPDQLLPKSKRKGYLPKPDWNYINDVCLRDQQLHQPLLDRFSRDLLLYRNWSMYGGKPPLFDPKRDIAFKSASLPNIVNKLTNMSSGVDHRYIVPFKNEQSKTASQVIENFHEYVRQNHESQYVASGGGASLQWDEFFFLYQYGRICYRILPNLDAADRGEPLPYHISLLDPATVFPAWAGDSGGLQRISRVLNTTLLQVVDDYGSMLPNLRDKIINQLGAEDYQTAAADTDLAGELREYWDTWNHAVSFKGIELFNEAHELGYVPFVYVMARGEPRNVAMPNGMIGARIDEYSNVLTPVGTGLDLREKGVSVFHHIVQTDKMAEVVFTMLLTEVLKAGNPPTITYSAPQYAGKPAPPLRMHAGATNQRVLNAQKVESVPTSPRPTDTSPVLQKVQKDLTEGSINTAMFGGMDGSNVAGFAIESLISAARDTILPYEQAFCYAQALKAQMILIQYRDQVSFHQKVAVPMDGRYGSDPTVDLTPDMIDLVGTACKVELIGVPDQALPMIMQASTMAVHEGFWSRRKAMEKLGEKDPDRMLSDIIAERAMEHPEMMENFIIPMGFVQRGQLDFAKLWTLFVIMPKIGPMMSSMTGMGSPAGPMSGPGGGGSGPMASGPPPGLASVLGGGGGPPPPGMNGGSNPMLGRARGRPTGPLPGQGRG